MVGIKELILILLIILVLFGAKRIPELAKGLGIGLKEFRKASKDLDKENTEESSESSDKN